MNKKAQGMSITVIIIAVLALLVLTILALVFTGGLADFTTKVSACENKGGKCALECGSEEYGTQNYPIVYTDWKCPVNEYDEQLICCVGSR